jgi:hypothetical protein
VWVCGCVRAKERVKERGTWGQSTALVLYFARLQGEEVNSHRGIYAANRLPSAEHVNVEGKKTSLKETNQGGEKNYLMGATATSYTRVLLARTSS